MSNTDLWDRLGKTDPKHTKPFQRSGGFKGTAIKPMWSYRMMTEEFGPCGQGWGIYEPSFQVVNGTDGEVLVYCTVSIWHGSAEKVVFGVGGDKVVSKFSSGLKSDDEAFKKAFTDAITNALKLIGVGADVHMGLFDDSKYVNSLKDEFSEKGDTDESRSRFIAACSDKIRKFADPLALRTWWASDTEKAARRDFELSKAEIDGLLAEIKTRLETIEGKKAA
jgi:hypothetical protein